MLTRKGWLKTLVAVSTLYGDAAAAQLSCQQLQILPGSVSSADSGGQSGATVGAVAQQSSTRHPLGRVSEAPIMLVLADPDATLLPVFLTQLGRLRDTSGYLLFREVVNVNQYAAVEEADKRIRSALRIADPDRPVRNPQPQAVAARKLYDAKCFLLARVRPIGDLLEFQVTVFDRSALPELSEPSVVLQDGRDSATVLPGPAVDRERSMSFFIDPRPDDLEQRIANGLARLFPSVNSRPQAVIRINGKQASRVRALPLKNVPAATVVAAGDTVALDAGESDDRDTPRERFRYRWLQVENDSMGNPKPERRLLFDANPMREVQRVVAPTAGSYTVALVVSDQIAADTVFALFDVINRPTVRPVQRDVRIGEKSFMLVTAFNLAGARRSQWLLVTDDSAPTDRICVRLTTLEESCDTTMSSDRVTVRWRKLPYGYEVKVDNRLCEGTLRCLGTTLSSFAPIFRREVNETIEIIPETRGVKGRPERVRFRTSHHPAFSFGVMAEQPIYTNRATEDSLIEGLSKTRYAFHLSARIVKPLSIDLLLPADTASWRPYQSGALQVTYHEDVSPNAQTAVIARFARSRTGWQFLPGIGVRWRAMTRTDVNGAVLWSKPGKAVLVGFGATMAML